MNRFHQLSEDERNDLYVSLSTRCNLIETGNENVSAVDAERANQHLEKKAQYNIRALSRYQMEILIRQRKMMEELLR